MARLYPTLFLFGFMACLGAAANTAKTGMRNMTSAQIAAHMGTGWNLGNTLDAHGSKQATGLDTETSWKKPLTTKAMIDRVKRQGFKTIRIPVTWYPHLGPAPDYTIDPAWLDRVETVANYAFANDMYVIINTHHEHWVVPTYATLDEVRIQLERIWMQIANRFKGYGDYLIFETLNEPRLVGSPEEWRGGTPEGRDVVNQLNLAAVNAIRATGGNNAKRHIMVPGYATSSIAVVIDDYVIPNNDSRIMVTCHYYSPFHFCLNVPGVTTWGTDADKMLMHADLDRVKNKFIDQGRAVVMGEWGAKDKTNTADRAAFSAYYSKEAKARKIVSVVWDDGGKYELLMRDTLTWKYPEIVKAVVAPK